ncbi:putative NHL repeat containing protein [Candidatus Sulfotelmatomonas gaucii]|uniref:Putative NHL repeat containing protein n=1 Tax=Candidatus Sulfuritelmatomonas gaucii TaxID=2043161 RepID=A0A2N9L4K2_9BACT|nr:putative NHL repeat containing protein [Candidatus Sulfotelmatomonas gaucii]
MNCSTDRTANKLSPWAASRNTRTIHPPHFRNLGLHTRRSRIRSCMAGTAVLLMAAVAAHAQFGAQTVGAMTGNQGITVTASAAGTVSSVEVLTLGSSGGDFAPGTGSSTCGGASLAIASTCTESVTFTPAAPGLRIGAVVLLGSVSGVRTVLGTAYLSGTGTGGLGVLVTGNVLPVAGQFGLYTAVDDGQPATQAELYLPSGVAVDGAGNMYIADSGHNRIRMVCASATTATIDGTTCAGAGIISTIAGNGNPSYAGDGGPAAGATLNNPGDVALDGAGNLYIADSGNGVIRVISAATGTITTIAGNATGTICASSTDSVGDGCAATQAKFNQPEGVTLDSSGNVYIADTSNHRIREVSAATGAISTIAGNGFVNANGTGGYNGDGIAATSAELNFPYAVALDAAGNMYIPDSRNHRVREVMAVGSVITPTSKIATFAGTGNAGATPCTATPVQAAQADVWTPSGVVVDAAGNVYIAETQNAAIRKVSAATGLISILAENGCGSTYFATEFQTVQLYGPIGLFLDGAGDLYFADTLDMVVREVQGNFAALNYSTPVRQGETSATQTQTVENDGNAALDLTSIVAATNAAIDTTVANSCAIGASLAINSDCEIGAVFAPAASPTLTGNQTETPNITVSEDAQPSIAAANNPLNIELVGTAEPVNSTTTTLTSNPNPSGFGQSVTFTVNVTTGPGTGNLTGMVTLADTFNGNTTTLVSGLALNASGTAIYAASGLGVGQHSIVASYAGDTTHFASSSTPALIQSVLEGTATALTSSANPSSVGQNVTFTATVTISSGGGVTPDGTVTFMDGTTILGTQTLNAGGVATYSTATLANGLHQISAIYNGDSSKEIEGSTSAVHSQDVLASSSITLTSSLNPSIYGNAVILTATIPSSATQSATGTVSFLDSGTLIGTGTLAGNPGAATFTTSSLMVGTHGISASYAGDAYNGASTSPVVSQTVNQAQTSTTVSVATSPGIAGSPETITATVRVITGAATPTGTMTFTSGTTQLGSATLSAGTATITPALAPGNYEIVATYSGDADDSGSASAPLPLTVVQATTQTAVTITPNPALVLAPITFTAKVTGNGGVPTGSVNFLANGNVIGAGTVGALGTATFSTSTLAAGTYVVTAAYTGDANNSGSTSGPVSLTVSLATTTTVVTVSPSPALVGSAITISAKVTGNGGTPTGSVNFIANGNILAGATLNTGTASFTTSSLTPGTYSITAAYAGDAADSPSTSTSVSETVNLIPTTTALGMASTTGTNPQVVLVASVQGSNGPTPTGTMTFNAGTTEIGSATLDSSGVATLTPNLTNGVNYNIVAVYSGDAVHTPSTSQPVTISGTAFGFNIGVTPPTVTVATSQNVTVNINLSSNGGFADTIGLGCASLPAGVTCHFSSPNLQLAANGVASAELTIDTNSPLSGGASAMNAGTQSRKISLSGLSLPLSLFFGWVFWCFRRRNAGVFAMIVALVLSAAALMTTGCNSFTQNTAAPGNYVIQVTGTGANSNVVHYQNVSLDITK